MRRQALLLVAAMSFNLSTTAQQTHIFPKLGIVKVHDIANLNKTFGYTSAISIEHLQPNARHRYMPQLKLKDLQQELVRHLSYLRIENLNQNMETVFEDMIYGIRNRPKLEPGCGSYPFPWFEPRFDFEFNLLSKLSPTHYQSAR